MNLFNVMKKRIEDLGLSEELMIFYEALFKNKSDKYIDEIVKYCDTNYFYINFERSNNDDKYDLGRLIVTFDDESCVHELKYIIHLSYTSCKDTYLPKILIERNEFVKGFVYQG